MVLATRRATLAAMLAALSGMPGVPAGALPVAHAHADAPCALDGLRLTGAMGGRAQAVTARPPYAYMASGSGIEAIDLAHPQAPRRVALGTLMPGAAPARIEDMTLEGPIAVAVTDRGQLRTFDIGSPPAVRQISELELPRGGARRVAVSGDRAYVLGYDAAMVVVDVSDPVRPSEVGTVPLRNQASAMAVADGHAYVAVNRYPDPDLAGLEILDLRARPLPRSVGWLPLADVSPLDIAAGDGRAVVLAQGEVPHLLVWDISDPARLALLGSIDTRLGRAAVDYLYGRSLLVAGSRAYVAQQKYERSLATPASANSADELLVFDIERPDAPVPLGRHEVHAGLAITDMAEAGHLVAIAVGDVLGGGWYGDVDPAAAGGLWLLDPGTLGWPTPIGRYAGLAHADRVLADGGHALVAEAQGIGVAGRSHGTLHAFETGRGAPWPVAGWSGGPIDAMAWIGRTRFVAALGRDADQGPRAALFDVAWLGAPLGPGGYAPLSSSDVVDAAADEHHAYLLSWPLPRDGQAQLHVVDATRGTTPVIVARLDIPAHGGWPGVVALVKDRLAVASPAGMRVVDVSDPLRPSIVGWRPDLGADRLAAGRDVLFAARTDGEDRTVLRIIDRLDALEPRLRAEIVIDRAGSPYPDARRVRAMAWSADRLLVALGGSLRLYDVTAPERPELLQELRIAGSAADIAVAGCQAALAAGDGGLQLFTLGAGVMPSMRERAYLPLAVAGVPAES